MEAGGTQAEVVPCEAESRVYCDIRQKMVGAEAWMLSAMQCLLLLGSSESRTIQCVELMSKSYSVIGHYGKTARTN